MIPKIVVAVAHKNSDPARVRSMARLRAHLGKRVYIETGPGPQDVWSVAMWRGAIELVPDATHVCCLNDDSEVPDDFAAVLHAMVSAVPDHCLALSSEHPKGPGLLAAGHHWYRCRAWVAGWGYCIPRGLLADFCLWREFQPPAKLRLLGEDNLINEWHGLSGRETWHPCPTIVSHDITMLSTYSGKLPDRACNTTVPWHAYPELRAAMRFRSFWTPPAEVPFLLVPSEEVRARTGT